MPLSSMMWIVHIVHHIISVHQLHSCSVGKSHGASILVSNAVARFNQTLVGSETDYARATLASPGPRRSIWDWKELSCKCPPWLRPKASHLYLPCVSGLSIHTGQHSQFLHYVFKGSDSCTKDTSIGTGPWLGSGQNFTVTLFQTRSFSLCCLDLNYSPLFPLFLISEF